ncbi:uncharacterized protein GGS22DRAFT_194594 [Annulohypoxylon maeteangense]|uniref:uncharacterized protein n=1 Tax=Annulohypoxylon maeteangense TaxID=1927788 RepID=UPI0020076F04|nr:uncharacterized protein GGS22DRAFT_194594 [Annulohypoxylon maeteangense]KAI0890677.1 hypothetical protein GGS22DRAFT_194594 [Annulohypoxylon maeteangense]
MSVEIPPGTDPSQTPLFVNPDGSPPNFDNPPSLKVVTYAVTIILIVTSFLLVLSRLRIHLKVHGKFAYDDYFCFIAWVLATVYGALIIKSTPTARHAWDVPLSAIDASWIKRSAVLATIYGPAMWFAKAAILMMYIRVFHVVRWMRWCCYIGIIFLFCAYWSLVPVSIVYNFPHRPNEHWDLALSLSSIPSQLPFMIMGLVSIVSDLYILILPFPVLLRLHISWKKKVGLGLVFITAAIGIACSCLVFYYRIVVWNNLSKDATWNVAASSLTVAIEINVAVIVSCAPAAAASYKLMAQESRFCSSIVSAVKSSRNLIHLASGSKEEKPNSDVKLTSLKAVGVRS